MESVAGAIFDDNKAHRFRLWRKWDSSKPMVLFIMLNPSTADADKNDPTVTRLIKFAQNFNYGGFYVGNIYSYITPYPETLYFLRSDEFKYEENLDHLLQMADECKDIIFGWGNGAKIFNSPAEITRMFPEAFCFELTNTGHPKHPLYLSNKSRLFKYSELIENRNKRYKKTDTKMEKTEETNLPAKPELTAEQVIETELKKFNLADAEIAKLSTKYLALKIKDVDDKEGIKAVSEALKDITKKNTGIEKTRVAEKALYLKIGKAIDTEAKRLTALITPIKEYLKKEEDRIENEIQQNKIDEQTKALNKINDRMQRLSAVGAAMDFEVMKNMTDEAFEVSFRELEAEFLLAPAKPTVFFGGKTVEVNMVGGIILDGERIQEKMYASGQAQDYGIDASIKLVRDLAFFDIESTGLNWEKDEPLQFAICVKKPNSPDAQWSSYCKPVYRNDIPEEITALTGITWDMVKDAPTFKELAPTIFEWLTNCDLAGYNIVGFDVPFLSQKFSDIDILWPLPDQKFVDAANIYKKMNPRTLGAAHLHYIGTDIEGAHNAVNDNLATKKVLEAQVKNHVFTLGDTVETISAYSMDGFIFVDAARKLSRDADGDMIYNIGASKGSKVKDDPNFGFWMLKQPWLSMHTREILYNELHNKPVQNVAAQEETVEVPEKKEVPADEIKKEEVPAKLGEVTTLNEDDELPI